MRRRGWLLGVLIGLAAAAVGAQEAPAQETPAQETPAQAAAPQSTAHQATVAAPAAPHRAPVVRRPRQRAAAKPAPLDVTKHPAEAPPPRLPDAEAGALAPVPNRNLEAPRVVPQDRASLGPSLLNRNLPGRGQAADGSPTLLEDKLFRPAPGARLRVPFSY